MKIFDVVPELSCSNAQKKKKEISFYQPDCLWGDNEFIQLTWSLLNNYTVPIYTNVYVSSGKLQLN